MKTMRNARWAEQEFGEAKLGDDRRRQRLVAMCARVASSPAGKVTEVFSESAEREGAFRLLENDAVSVDEIGRAAHGAAARRCRGADYVWVPADGTSLNLTDPERRKGLGVVGTRSIGAQGLQVMTAIAILPDGTPAGLVGQRFWTRPKRSTAKKNDRRPVGDKETRHWLDVMSQARQAFAAEAPSVRPWFQLDRGGDAWPVLLDALDTQSLLTVRAANDRRLMGTLDGAREYLWPTLERRKAAAHYDLEVPSGPKRQARTARMEIQFCRVVLDLQDPRTKKHRFTPLWAVRTHEVRTTPAGEAAIEWLLLTTFPVTDVAAAKLVIAGYATRWRIEEFHKAWKTGACHVEDTLLEARDHIERWATILASVAMRIVRLTYLSRVTPKAPATVELTQPEIDAVILLKKPRGVRRGATPTIAEVTRWIADLGGYVGKSSGGPPGALVIARGLRRIEPIVSVLDGGGEL
jgi:hypothetical protein